MSVMRVRRLGTGGYRFRYPAYVRVSPHPKIHNQLRLEMLVVDERDMLAMESRRGGMYDFGLGGYDFGLGGFSAPQQHLSHVSEEEAAIAEALFALNDGTFVKRVNKVSEGEEQ